MRGQKKRAELVCEICSLTFHKLVAIQASSYGDSKAKGASINFHRQIAQNVPEAVMRRNMRFS